MSQKRYRHRAQEHLDRARRELASDDGPEHLQYAALELRMALEAIIYDRINAYADDLDPKAYNNWKLQNVMKLLLAVAPNANERSKITVTVDAQPGEPATPPIYLGTDEVFPSNELEKAYHRLGNYLHVPTIKQIDDGKTFDETKARDACQDIFGKISNVLSSKARNVKIGSVAKSECVECENVLVKRIFKDESKTEARCFYCRAEYILTIDGKKVVWMPNQISINCQKEGCGSQYFFWSYDIAVGKTWTCDECNSKWVFAFGVSPDHGQALFAP